MVKSKKQLKSEQRLETHSFNRFGNYYLPKSLVSSSAYCLAYGVAKEIGFEKALKKTNPYLNIVSVDGTPATVKWFSGLENPPSKLEPSVYSDKNSSSLNFYRDPVNKGCHSLINKWGDNAVVDVVEGKNLFTLMEELNWRDLDILKADIEGLAPNLINELCRHNIRPKACLFEFEHYVEGSKGYDKRVDQMNQSLKHMKDFGYTSYLNRSKDKFLTEVVCILQ